MNHYCGSNVHTCNNANKYKHVHVHEQHVHTCTCERTVCVHTSQSRIALSRMLCVCVYVMHAVCFNNKLVPGEAMHANQVGPVIALLCVRSHRHRLECIHSMHGGCWQLGRTTDDARPHACSSFASCAHARARGVRLRRSPR